VKVGGNSCREKEEKKLEASPKICLFFSSQCFCCLIAIETSHQPKKELLLASVGRQKQKGEKHL